jgi:hypothetical protein
VSYARFGWEGSDVYVFLSVSGGLECCGCSIKEIGPSPLFDTTEEMLAHLEEHRSNDHTVPASTIEELKADAIENDQWIAEHQSEQRMSPTEKAGWAGLAIGFVLGATSVMLLARAVWM